MQPNKTSVFVFLGTVVRAMSEREKRERTRESEGASARRESGSKEGNVIIRKGKPGERVATREMKSSLRLPSPVSLALAPGRAARRRGSQIGSRGPASSSPDAWDGPAKQEEG